MPFKATGFALSVSMLALAAPAQAQSTSSQENAADESSDKPDDIVVTAQREARTEVSRGGQLGALGDKAAADVPFSIKSYNSALILNQQSLTLGQVLENDPTIRTTYGFGNAAESFVIRGFDLAGDDIALDGLYGLTPRQLVAPELYESVQVLNGASAFLNGAAPGGSGIGGTVNLIPKRAGDEPLTRVTAGYLSDAHVGGSFDVARRFGTDDRFGVRINGAARRGDVAIDDEFRSTYVVGGGFDFRGEDVRLSLDLAYQRYKVTHLRSKVRLGAVTAIPRVPRADANYNQDFTYTTLRDVFGVAKGEWDVTENAMLYASLGARDGSERGIYDGITVNDVDTGAARGTALLVNRTDNNEAAQAGLRVKLGASGISQEINVGVSALWQVNRNAYNFLGGFTGFATNLYTTPRVVRPGPAGDYIGGDLDDPFPVGRTRLFSTFASDTVGFFGDRVLVTGGLRLQRIQNKSYSYADGALDTAYETDAITPVIGVIVKPAAGLSLFANRIEALTPGDTAPPDFTDPVTGGTLPVSNANETLPATKSKQYELGGKLALARFNASVALFNTERPLSYTSTDGAAPGTAIFAPFGRQRNRGIELSVDGELAHGLRVIAGGSYIDAKLRETGDPTIDGNDAPGVPDWLANANVEWDMPFVTGLTLTGRVVYTGKQDVDAANTLRLPDWTRFDLGARFVADVVDKPLTFRFGVDNVANKRFWAASFDPFAPQLLQGAPRSYRASVSIDF